MTGYVRTLVTANQDLVRSRGRHEHGDATGCAIGGRHVAFQGHAGTWPRRALGGIQGRMEEFSICRVPDDEIKPCLGNLPARREQDENGLPHVVS